MDARSTDIKATILHNSKVKALTPRDPLPHIQKDGLDLNLRQVQARESDGFKLKDKRNTHLYEIGQEKHKQKNNFLGSDNSAN